MAYHDLNEIFDSINVRFFNGRLKVKALKWFVTRGTCMGKYVPSERMIYISTIFDSPNIPRESIEFLMYHEMLHIKFPPTYNALPVQQRIMAWAKEGFTGRMPRESRSIHHRKFRAEERKFPNFKEVNASLDAIWEFHHRPEAYTQYLTARTNELVTMAVTAYVGLA